MPIRAENFQTRTAIYFCFLTEIYNQIHDHQRNHTSQHMQDVHTRNHINETSGNPVTITRQRDARLTKLKKAIKLKEHERDTQCSG